MADANKNLRRVIEAAKPSQGDIAVIFGSSDNSLRVLEEAKKQSLKCIFCSDQENILRSAQGTADQVMEYSPTVYERLASFPEAESPNIMIDLLGKPEFLTNAVKIISPAGRIVLACQNRQQATYQMRVVSHKELDIIGMPTAGESE